MNIRLLQENDEAELYTAFQSAFSTSSVGASTSLQNFQYRLYQKLKIDFTISAGLFEENLVGFILHTSNLYEDIPTAYNGGTGVLPGFRNQQLAESIYEYLLPRIREKLDARIILEVIDANAAAIKLYEKIGFQIRRKFRCYRQVRPMDLSFTHETEKATISELDFSFGDYLPSFIDSENQLRNGSEKVLTVRQHGKILGFLIFQPHLGRISQLAVDPASRNERIGQSLVFRAQQLSKFKLTIMNIPDSEIGFHKFLLACGFKNEIDQFEMEYIL
ncbi:MAG: GNAT family N-acetyltransferase [Bacteroidota bacterium]